MSRSLLPRPRWMNRLRRPEYTGENRCTPCTIVNLLIAVVLAGAAAQVSIPLGVGVFAASLVAILLRGYLVPYTPALTARYFPDRVLRWFDKDSPERAASTAEAVEDVDVEAVLYEAGVLTECDQIDDLCVEPAFQRAWRDRIEELRGRESLRENLVDAFDLDGDHRIEEYGDDARVLRVDGRHFGQWESDAALVADLAADEVLARHHDGWTDLHVANRSEVLGSLRLFLERCPGCDAEVSFDTDRARSCCLAIDVAAMRCRSCGDTIFEYKLSEDLG